MQLSRLDTQRIVRPKGLTPKDSFEAKDGLELEWDEEREVVYLRQKKEGVSAITGAKLQPKLVLVAIVPLANVAFMHPLSDKE